jgi:hypothetical protein
MNKKLILNVTAISMAVILFSGCSKDALVKPDFSQCKVQGELAPQWACDSDVEGGIAATGIGVKTAAGASFQRTMAMADARDQLAQQVSVKVKNMVKNFMQITGVGASETVDTTSARVSKQVANQTLNGSKKKGQWHAPDGSLYVFVVLDPNLVKGEVKKALKTSFKNDGAMYQKFLAKQAQAELDAAIEMEMR